MTEYSRNAALEMLFYHKFEERFRGGSYPNEFRKSPEGRALFEQWSRSPEAFTDALERLWDVIGENTSLRQRLME